MPKLVFRVASDWEEVVKLRNEIAKLKQELKGMDSTQSPADFKTLNTQLAASTQRMDELVTNAAKAGADIFFVPNNPVDEETLKKDPDAKTNYEEAVEVAKDLDTDMKIVPVTTVQEAIDYLRNND